MNPGALFQLMRPRQWVKNGFVLAPVIFAQQYDELEAWRLALGTALAFILLSGAVYIFNDLRDRAGDALHPVKRLRPLASGVVKPLQAALFAMVLLIAAAWLVHGLPGPVAGVLAVYTLGNLYYTLWLKHVALLDVLTLAAFYVMRVLAGCYAIDVFISPWIVLTTFLLAMFMAFGKRYHEISIAEYAAQKAALQHYSRELLDRLVIICGGAALLAYAIYAVEMAQRLQRFEMVYTVAFVAFGLFRYLQKLLVFKQGGEPEMLLLKDPLMFANVALWLATCIWAMD